MEDVNQSETIVANESSFKEKFFSTKWRISGRQYALYSACLGLGYFAICAIIWFIYWFIKWLSWQSLDNIESFSIIAALIVLIPVLIISIIIAVKRVHDFWKRGSYVRCLLIPFYNIYVWIQLLFQKWDQNENEYWPKPQTFGTGKKTLTIILYLIYIIIQVISRTNSSL